MQVAKKGGGLGCLWNGQGRERICSRFGGGKAKFLLQMELGMLVHTVVQLPGCMWVPHGQEVEAQVELCFASSAALVEIRAGLAALRWASAQGFLETCIQMDSSIFVHGLCNP